MRYRNVKTGAVIDVKSEISGGNWERIDGKAPAKEPSVSSPISPSSKSLIALFLISSAFGALNIIRP
jgi:hypothetical protein